jgi:hypothetical protein
MSHRVRSGEYRVGIGFLDKNWQILGNHFDTHISRV